jgi:hypothetical protein
MKLFLDLVDHRYKANQGASQDGPLLTLPILQALKYSASLRHDLELVT